MITVQAKFKPEEMVWFVLSGRAVRFPIYLVKTETSKTGTEVSYLVDTSVIERVYRFEVVKECDVFLSRELLIESL